MNVFIETIRSIFVSNPYDITTSKSEYLYVHDDKGAKQTFMSEINLLPNISIQLSNPNKYEIVHICIDGGLIEYGLFDYVGDGLPHGRNDCMVFSGKELLLIELKMDVEEDSLDKTRWAKYSDAMRQITDFYLYLKNQLEKKEKPITIFYSQTAIHPIVCMKNPPKSSAQRNNEKEKFRIKTKLKIETGIKYDFI